MRVVAGSGPAVARFRSSRAAQACATRRGARAGMVHTLGGPLPRLVAFDLDGTLWWPEMDMLYGGKPFRRDERGRVFDSSGTQVKLIGTSAAILDELATAPQWRDSQVAYVSRTTMPDDAHACLGAFVLQGGRTAAELAQHKEIYPGRKTTHFRKIQAASGVPYEDMVFFDNERRNIEDVSKLGVTSVYCPDGMTDDVWQRGLQEFARRQAALQQAERR